ncbi:unnamed protein product [Cuscuta campestris]|uniref:HIT-type domain-containing protein n=1 Tax=Cuscuta campestris TaxID=132261 RepID=A0A484NQ02_9ASTE|nr:unnamed protein product [Cuscuta campestris]
MGGGEAQAAAEAHSEAQCEECKLNPWRYKCPGCLRRTCSLPCVKAHKQKSGCTGKKPFNEVVPISQFDDNLILSDYNMLEDVKRVADAARIMRSRFSMYPSFNLPRPLLALRRAAFTRRVTLGFMSAGLSKREKNLTYYDKRLKFISWTIEWQFHSKNSKNDVVLMDHGVNEKAKLRDVIEKHLKPGPWKHPLKQFCDVPLDSLKVFIRKRHQGKKSPYVRLDINTPLRQQLSNLVILEYPVFHVFLPSHPIKFKVIKNSIRRQVKPMDFGKNDSPSSHKGVTFKEEEIEDGEFSVPRVPEQAKPMDCSNNDSPLSNKGVTFKEEMIEDDDPLDHRVSDLVQDADVDFIPKISSTQEKGAKEQPLLDISSDKDSGAVDMAFLDQMAFEFDPKLIDPYTNLFAGADPDAYLDGLLSGDQYVLDGNWADFGNGMPPDEEELEEGEIAP